MKRHFQDAKSATVPAFADAEALHLAAFNQFPGGDFEGVQTALVFNYGEFAIIKIGVVDLLPRFEVLQRVAITKPVGNQHAVAFEAVAHVRQADVVVREANLFAFDEEGCTLRFHGKNG